MNNNPVIDLIESDDNESLFPDSVPGVVRWFYGGD